MRGKSVLRATSDVAILSRILEPAKPALSPEAAHCILALGFPPADEERMHDLAEKARQGTLSPAETIEINNYERVGHLLSLLKLKARRSLKSVAPANGQRRS